MTPQSNPPQTAAEADPRRWVALIILLLASFMNLVDVSIVNVALPSLQSNLGASSSQIEWTVAAYVLSFALFLLPFGRLADIEATKSEPNGHGKPGEKSKYEQPGRGPRKYSRGARRGWGRPCEPGQHQYDEQGADRYERGQIDGR